MLRLTQSTDIRSSVRLIFICTILNEEQSGSFVLILRPNFKKTWTGKNIAQLQLLLGGSTILLARKPASSINQDCFPVSTNIFFTFRSNADCWINKNGSLAFRKISRFEGLDRIRCNHQLLALISHGYMGLGGANFRSSENGFVHRTRPGLHSKMHQYFLKFLIHHRWLYFFWAGKSV